jgi:hypothetical protein
MSWVRRTEDAAPAHVCEPPMREVVYTLPAMPPPPKGWQGNEPSKPSKMRATEIDGKQGDLWRCDDCDRLWRIGLHCTVCTRGYSHYGRCGRTVAWLPATLWQRLRHRKASSQ